MVRYRRLYTFHKWLIPVFSKITETTFTRTQSDVHSVGKSLHPYRKWRHWLFQISSNSHKFIHFACSWRDIAITIQLISKRFTVLEKVIQVRHFLFVSSYTFLLIDPESGAQVDLRPSTHYINGYFHVIFAFKSHIRVDAWACINVFGTRGSKHYVRQSHWDECRRVSHYPTNWLSFFFLSPVDMPRSC